MLTLQQRLRNNEIENFDAQARAWTAEKIAELVHPEATAVAGALPLHRALLAWHTLSVVLGNLLSEENKPHVDLAEKWQGSAKDLIISAILQFREWQRKTADNAEKMRASIKSLMDAWTELRFNTVTPAEIRANRTKQNELKAIDFFGQRTMEIENLQDKYVGMQLTNRVAFIKYYSEALEAEKTIEPFRELPALVFPENKVKHQIILNIIGGPPLAGDKTSPTSKQLKAMYGAWQAEREAKNLAAQRSATEKTVSRLIAEQTAATQAVEEAQAKQAVATQAVEKAQAQLAAIKKAADEAANEAATQVTAAESADSGCVIS